MHVNIEVGSQQEILKQQCSCTNCDSVDCFVRRADESCACDSCKVSKSCLFYNNNANLSESSGSINSKNKEREITPEDIAKEFVRKEGTYKFNKNISRHTLSNKQSRMCYSQLTMEEENLIQNANATLDSVTYSGKEASLSKAKLSAQIMDLPYKDFQTSYKSNLSTNNMIMSPFDIFNKIKEAYKACSCKFCECIAGKSMQNDLCKCKPCDCKDCANFISNVKSFTNSGKKISKEDEGCPCIRCDRGSCKGIGKKSTDANECDCVGLLSNDCGIRNRFSRACKCVPCQCNECKFLSVHGNNTLIVAPVGEEHQQQDACQCSPCECFNCGHGYGLSNQHHEMSTSVNRHPYCHCEMCANEACVPDDNQICRCERQSGIMSKPFQRGSHDYDIHTANVKYDGRREYSSDQIAMFAALTNAYPKLDTTKRQCNCDECECLQCQYKEYVGCDYDSNFFEPIQIHQLNNNPFECRCAPCECQMCAKSNNYKLHNTYSSKIFDCINCENSVDTHDETAIRTSNHNKERQNQYCAKGDCKCNPCECADCEKLMFTCSRTTCQCSNCKCESCGAKVCYDKDMYPVKMGERMTSTVFKKKINDAFIESCMNTLEGNNNSLRPSAILKPTLDKPSAFSSFLNTRKTFLTQSQFSDNITTRTIKQYEHANVLKYENGINENKSLTESKFNSRENKNETQLSRRGLKYWESSYNSLENDYLNDLLNFPSTTAKTCLNDIMQFDSYIMNDHMHNMKDQFYTVGEKQYTTLTTDKEKNDIAGKSYVSNYEPETQSYIYENNLSGTANLVANEKDYILHNTASNFENNPYRPCNLDSISKTEKCYPNPQERITNSALKYCHSIEYKNDLAADSNQIDVNNYKLDEDYHSMQRILHDARVFSLQLVELLKKYEKANKDLKSISDKIKCSNDTNNWKCQKTAKTGLHKILFAIDDVSTKEVQKSKSSLGSLAEELVEINKKASVDRLTERESSLDDKRSILSANIMFNSEEQNSKCDELTFTKDEKEPNERSDQKHTKRKYIKQLRKKYSKMYKRSMIYYNRMTKSTNNVEVDATIPTEDMKHIQSTPRPINQNHITGELHNFKGDKMKRDINLSDHENLLKCENSSTTQLIISATDEYSKSPHYVQHEVRQPNILYEGPKVDLKSDGPWLMKKNACLNSTNTSVMNRRVSLFSPLEKSIKDTVQSISLQTGSENATYLYENKALVKLHSEVKKLLEMPVLQKKHTENDTQKDACSPDATKTSSQTSQCADSRNASINNRNLLTNSKYNCGELKVNSLQVRRVSDHTVLVKWEVPRDFANVKGYELLVDGRAVQKILSPSRRMAVVTCLPHIDTVLLTVRTVVSQQSHQHFACTVVYHPRYRF